MKAWGKRLTAYALALMALAASCASCDDNNGKPVSYRYDVVTYAGSHAGTSLFEYWGRNDSACVRLRTKATTPQWLTQGSRVLMRYELNGNDSAGWQGASVYSLTRIISDSLRMAMPAAILRRTPHPVSLNSIWRTGEFINVYCTVPYTAEPRIFSLVADATTLRADTVHCYLEHELPSGSTAYFDRRCLASFNVGAAWNRASCRAIRVHLSDSRFPTVGHYDFCKDK